MPSMKIIRRLTFAQPWMLGVAFVVVTLQAFSALAVAQEAAAEPAKPAAAAEEEEFERAWEERPYQVKVWLCSDGSPHLSAMFEDLVAGVLVRSELLDPSGWFLHVETPEPKWRNRSLRNIGQPEKMFGEDELPELDGFDKLMIVTMHSEYGQTVVKVREFDAQTQQWGPLVMRQERQIHQLDATILDAIAVAFMPIAKINRVSEKDEVFVSARAMNSCMRSRPNQEGVLEVDWITDSPVWVRSNDRYLPIIRRTNREGQLIKLEPIDFTFLTIEEQEGPKTVCSIQSYHRAPLAGRTSKRAQKLALVIRPPNRSTKLKLISRDEDAKALEGIEILSRLPGQDREIASEFIGKTDWKGELEIPPSEHGLRVLYVKRGSRALKKLPMMPGLYADLTTTVRNDETRLFAEGIINGLNTEILNLVAQREVFESDIDEALKKNDLDKARKVLAEYMELESPLDIKNRMANEEARLKAETTDQNEGKYINTMFQTLRNILNSKVVQSREIELREKIQKMTNNGKSQ